MGTINYKTSDYITLGAIPYVFDDFRDDPELTDYTDKDIYQMMQDYTDEDYENIKTILEDNYFYYFHVSIESGYYEGFHLMIENNFPVYFEDCYEKREAQKEITEIKKFLIQCAGHGLVSCSCGWCMGYTDYKRTIKDISAAIKEMRAEVASTPTWRQYEKTEMAVM